MVGIDPDQKLKCLKGLSWLDATRPLPSWGPTSCAALSTGLLHVISPGSPASRTAQGSRCQAPANAALLCRQLL